MFVRSSKDSRKGSATQKTAITGGALTLLMAASVLFGFEVPKEVKDAIPYVVALLLFVKGYYQRRATNGGQ